MKFHSPTDEPVHIGLTSGHTLLITPEGVETPQMFRREAIARGCLPEGVTAEQVAGGEQFQRKKAIADAMEAMMDGNSPEDFTKDGKPDLRRLNARVGFTVQRSEADAVWAEVSQAD